LDHLNASEAIFVQVFIHVELVTYKVSLCFTFSLWVFGGILSAFGKLFSLLLEKEKFLKNIVFAVFCRVWF